MMYDVIHRVVPSNVPRHILELTSEIHNYRTRSTSRHCFYMYTIPELAL